MSCLHPIIKQGQHIWWVSAFRLALERMTMMPRGDGDAPRRLALAHDPMTTLCTPQQVHHDEEKAFLDVLLTPLIPIPPQAAHLCVDPAARLASSSSSSPPLQQNMLPRTHLTMLLLAALAVLLQPLPGRAANPKVPHPHKGVLEVRRQRRCVPSASKCGNDRR